MKVTSLPWDLIASRFLAAFSSPAMKRKERGNGDQTHQFVHNE